MDILIKLRNACCREFAVSLEEIKDTRRKQRSGNARMAYVILVRDLRMFTQEEIAEQIGRKNVCQIEKRARKEIEDKPLLRLKVIKIKNYFHKYYN